VFVDGELPHATHDIRASTMIGAAMTICLSLLRNTRHTEPSMTKPHASGFVSDGRSSFDTAAAVVEPVVATVTVTDCTALSLVCTELGSVQVGAGETTGVTAQVRFTVPVNEPVGVKARLKLAVCPALMV
jgi:hypothetical protein